MSYFPNLQAFQSGDSTFSDFSFTKEQLSIRNSVNLESLDIAWYNGELPSLFLLLKSAPLSISNLPTLWSPLFLIET